MGGPRYGDRNGYSPDRYGDRNGRGRFRSASPRGRSRSRKGGGKGGPAKQGRHKITVENLPDDMSWQELKDLVVDRGPSITFARTFEYQRVHCGMVEFEYREDAEAVLRELDDRRIEGSRGRLRVCYGDLSREPGAKNYPAKGKGRDRDRGDDRGGYQRRRDDSRPPPRSDFKKDEDDGPIMTLFVADLPDDAREGEIMDELDRYGAARVVIMNKGNETSAFVRFRSVDDAEHAMDRISSGRVELCQRRVNAEMARRNTRL